MMKNGLKGKAARFTAATAAAVNVFLLQASAAGGSIASSQIGTGLTKMINDISTFLTVLCPVAGGSAAVFFLIRRGLADEQDGKMWTRRIVAAIGCGAGGMLVSGVISLVTSYF